MKVPVFRLSLQNATILSVVWLAAATLVEAARRYGHWRWAEKGVLAIEAFPMRVWEFLGLMGPLREAYFHGDLSTWQLRVLLGLTTVAVIITLAMVVGLMMWVVAGRLAARAQPPPGAPRG